MSQYEFHEAANLFPLLQDISPQAFDELVADLIVRGQQQPIIIFRNKILDGRNRYLACRAAKIEPRFEEIETDDPVAYSLSANLRRRDLNSGQRAIIAAAARKLYEPAAQARMLAGTLAPIGARVKTAEQAAQMTGASTRSTERAAHVLEHATPAVVDAVRSGQVAVADAAAVADLPAAEQEAAVDDVQAGRSRTLRRAAGRIVPPSGVAALAELRNVIGRTRPALDAANRAFPGGAFYGRLRTHLEAALEVAAEWQRAAGTSGPGEGNSQLAGEVAA